MRVQPCPATPSTSLTQHLPCTLVGHTQSFGRSLFTVSATHKLGTSVRSNGCRVLPQITLQSTFCCVIPASVQNTYSSDSFTTSPTFLSVCAGSTDLLQPHALQWVAFRTSQLSKRPRRQILQTRAAGADAVRRTSSDSQPEGYNCLLTLSRRL